MQSIDLQTVLVALFGAGGGGLLTSWAQSRREGRDSNMGLAERAEALAAKALRQVEEVHGELVEAQKRIALQDLEISQLRLDLEKCKAAAREYGVNLD